MKLERVDPPFDKIYKNAYVYKSNQCNRTIIKLSNGDARKTMLYSRYLMCVQLGRILSENETVDHIDNDPTNDDINNLQILSMADNVKKYKHTLPPLQHGTNNMYRNGCRCEQCRQWKSEYQRTYRALHGKPAAHIEKICAYCGKIFYTTSNHKAAKFCSCQCAGKYRGLRYKQGGIA